MAVQKLSSETLVFDERIVIPRRVNGEVIQYKVGNNDVSFFRCDNGDAGKVVIGRHAVFGDAKYVVFDRMDLGTHYAVGSPSYYDGRGKLLKIGNR